MRLVFNSRYGRIYVFDYGVLALRFAEYWDAKAEKVPDSKKWMVRWNAKV